MDRIPEGAGTRYRIELPGAVFAAHAEGIRAELSRMARSVSSREGTYFEYWDPEDPRGGFMPNMIVDAGDERITVCDLGGHDGVLLRALDATLAGWSERLGCEARLTTHED